MDRKSCKCGKPARSKGFRYGIEKWHNECHSCYRARRKKIGKAIPKRKSLRERYLKDSCECCGFIPDHEIQLQLDHIDGNTANNRPSNFQTLCANCHTLKTWTNGDWKTPSRRPLDCVSTDQQYKLIQ